MDSSYSLQYLFENDDRYIMQVTAKDMISENGWLLYYKTSHSFVPMNFKCMDSSTLVEERFFDEGFLKVNTDNATFIEKVTRKIETLKNLGSESLPKSLLEELNHFFQMSHIKASF